MDEPTAGLDPINAQKIKRYIIKLKTQGKTIFVTTHDMTTADELCDRVSFIAGGEIRLSLDRNELLFERTLEGVEMLLIHSAHFPFGLARGCAAKYTSRSLVSLTIVYTCVVARLA